MADRLSNIVTTMFRKKSFSFFLLLTLGISASAQDIDTLTSDGLFQAARKAAFDNKDYELAKHYLHKGLSISPDYADLKIFLGRIHTWTDQKDSARYYFTSVLKTKPDYEDASLAWADLEYWNDNNQKALTIVDSGLIYHPSSTDLLIRKAKIYDAMRNYAQADVAIQKILAIDKNNTGARSLSLRIKEQSTKNKFGISYDFVYFDRQYSDPWHLSSFEYTRTTGIGSVTARINYANRFKEGRFQYEMDAYPRLSKTFYSYVSAGYSETPGVFPKWRAGFSLYANLPKSWEADLGFRYLFFSGDPTWIYTGAIGKYYKSWLFGLRAYLTPATNSNAVSTSYTASARYYFGSADDLVGITAGYGISPDDRVNTIQFATKMQLISYKAGILFKKKVSRFSVIGADFNWMNQEYLPDTNGNQYQFSISWLIRF
jgi:YaiO family outer membrane protein